MKITRNNFNVTSTRYSRNGLKVGNFVFTLTNVRFCVLSMLAILTSSLVVVTLQSVTETVDLGFSLTSNLSWNTETQKVVNKANKIVGFLERNVGPGNKEVFSRLCNALIIPILEYAVPLVTILGWSSRQSRRTYLSLLKCYKTIHGVNDLNSNHYDYFEFYTTAHRRFVISTGSCTFIGL